MTVRRSFAFIAAFFLIVTLGGTAPAAAAPHQYYLSLGDSLAFGYQPEIGTSGHAPATAYRGYAEDYATRHRDLTLVNFGCPAETSASMLGIGVAPGPVTCPWPERGLHQGYGSANDQAQAAVDFLLGHPGQVKLITIDIGSNDMLALVRQCQKASDVTKCLTAGLPGTLYALDVNYATLLGELHAAAAQSGNNPQIVLFNYYNPLAVAIPGSDALAQAASAIVDQVAAGAGASVADAFSAINGTAGSAMETARVCSLTWECSRYQDVHPDSRGYAALARALADAVH
jgi:lysophospholipase L1-like esterase